MRENIPNWLGSQWHDKWCHPGKLIHFTGLGFYLLAETRGREGKKLVLKGNGSHFLLTGESVTNHWCSISEWRPVKANVKLEVSGWEAIKFQCFAWWEWLGAAECRQAALRSLHLVKCRGPNSGLVYRHVPLGKVSGPNFSGGVDLMLGLGGSECNIHQRGSAKWEQLDVWTRGGPWKT